MHIRYPVQFDKRVERRGMISEEGIEKMGEDIETLKGTFASLTRSLLETQRLLAATIIDCKVETLAGVIDSHLHDVNLRTQLIVDATSAKAKLSESDTPFKLAIGFKTSWQDKLRKLGVSGISY